MNWKAFVAEFVGTFALIFVGVGSIAASFIANNGAPDLVAIALAHGFVIGVMATATGAISGGHFNPAVTLGALIAGKITPTNALGYWVSQILAAIAGAFMIQQAMPLDALNAVGMGTPALADGITITMGLIMEVILTFFLVFVIFGSAIDRRAPKAGGLYIGLAVSLGVLAGGPTTGAAMNPARYLGPALLGGGTENLLLYIIGPLLGGALAALIYHFILEKE